MAKFERLGAFAGVVHCVTIDEASNIAYIFTGSGPSYSINKVDLTNLVSLGSITVSVPNVVCRTAVIDVAAGFAYFVSDKSVVPEFIYKIQLSPLAEITTLTVPDSRFMRASQIDPAGGFAYFFSVYQATANTYITKVDLSTFLVSLQLQVLGTTVPEDAKIDVANGHIYYVEGTNARKILTSNLTEVTNSPIPGGDFGTSVQLRIADGYFYIGSNTGKIHRKNLALADLGTTTLAAADSVNFLAYQVADQRLYAVQDRGPGTPIRVAKLEGATNTEIRDLDLNPSDLTSTTHNLSVFNSTLRNLFVGTSFGTLALVKISTPLIEDLEGSVAGKVRLQDPTSDPIAITTFLARDRDYDEFQRVRGLETPDGEGVNVALLDGFGYAYICNDLNPGTVRKIRLSDMSFVGSLVLSQGPVTCGCIDPANGFAYFGTFTTFPARVLKVDINAMTQVGNLSLGLNSQQSSGCDIDTAGGLAFFTYIDSGSGSSVARIALSSFTITGSVSGLLVGNIRRVSLDIPNSRLYCTGDGSTNVIRINTTTMAVAPGGGSIGVGEASTALKMDSGTGNLYVGLSSGKISRIPVSTMVVNATVIIAGHPTSLILDPGIAIYPGINGTSPLQIQKVRLSDFTLVNSIVLVTGENGINTQFSSTVNLANKISYWGCSAASPGDFVEVAIPVPEINLDVISDSIILEATMTEPVKGELTLHIGVSSPIAGTTILDAAAASSISGYVQLDQYGESSFAGKAIVSAATQDSIAGTTIVAQVLTSRIAEKVILETTTTDKIAGKVVLEVIQTSIVAGKEILAAVATDKIAGKAIVAAVGTDKIVGKVNVAIEGTDLVAAGIDLVDPPGTAIAYKTILETGLVSYINGSLDMRRTLMEPILVYRS